MNILIMLGTASEGMARSILYTLNSLLSKHPECIVYIDEGAKKIRYKESYNFTNVDKIINSDTLDAIITLSSLERRKLPDPIKSYKGPHLQIVNGFKEIEGLRGKPSMIINISPDCQLEKYGIPQSKVRDYFSFNEYAHLLDKIVVPQNSIGSLSSALHIVTKNHNNLYATIQIIKQYNKLSDNNKLTILCKPKQLSLLKRIVNKNVNLLNIDAPHDNLDIDFYIGDGYPVQHLADRIPCLIVGNRGYGGIVDECNFLRQYKSCFQGRIYGDIEEVIPDDLFGEELRYLINKRNNLALYQNIEKLKTQKCQIFDSESLYLIIKETCSKENLTYDTILSLADNIELIKEADYYLISDKNTQKLFGSIESEEYIVLNKLNGINSIINVADSLGLDKSELKFYIESLLQAEILVIL